jgi:hypothetical protein
VKQKNGQQDVLRIVFDKHLGQWNYLAIPEAGISEVA